MERTVIPSLLRCPKYSTAVEACLPYSMSVDEMVGTLGASPFGPTRGSLKGWKGAASTEDAQAASIRYRAFILVVMKGGNDCREV